MLYKKMIVRLLVTENQMIWLAMLVAANYASICKQQFDMCKMNLNRFCAPKTVFNSNTDLYGTQME